MPERGVKGAGIVEFVHLPKALAGHSGWVVVEAEQDAKIARPSKYARLGHKNLLGFLAQDGLV